MKSHRKALIKPSRKVADAIYIMCRMFQTARPTLHLIGRLQHED
jgi:hypothetical protein